MLLALDACYVCSFDLWWLDPELEVYGVVAGGRMEARAAVGPSGLHVRLFPRRETPHCKHRRHLKQRMFETMSFLCSSGGSRNQHHCAGNWSSFAALAEKGRTFVVEDLYCQNFKRKKKDSCFFSVASHLSPCCLMEHWATGQVGAAPLAITESSQGQITHNSEVLLFLFSKCKCPMERYNAERLQRATFLQSLQVRHLNVCTHSSCWS